MNNETKNDQQLLQDKVKKGSPNEEFEEDTQYLDKVCRLLFPLVFGTFLVVYWISYLYII